MTPRTKYYPLFAHLHEQHGLICTESELYEIIRIAKRLARRRKNKRKP